MSLTNDTILFPGVNYPAKRQICAVGAEVARIAGERVVGPPHSGKIGLAVGGAWGSANLPGVRMWVGRTRGLMKTWPARSALPGPTVTSDSLATLAYSPKRIADRSEMLRADESGFWRKRDAVD